MVDLAQLINMSLTAVFSFSGSFLQHPQQHTVEYVTLNRLANTSPILAKNNMNVGIPITA